MKKILALLLTVIMLGASMGAGASAEEANPAAEEFNQAEEYPPPQPPISWWQQIGTALLGFAWMFGVPLLGLLLSPITVPWQLISRLFR